MQSRLKTASNFAPATQTISSQKIWLRVLTKESASFIFRNMSNCCNIDLTRLSEMFKALSNPKRLSIFTRLASCCAPGTKCSVDSQEARSCVGELGKDLGIVPSTVSHHIKELHRAGLIRVERNGQNVECWVSPEAVKEVAAFFNSFISG